MGSWRLWLGSLLSRRCPASIKPRGTNTMDRNPCFLLLWDVRAARGISVRVHPAEESLRGQQVDVVPGRVDRDATAIRVLAAHGHREAQACRLWQVHHGEEEKGRTAVTPNRS